MTIQEHLSELKEGETLVVLTAAGGGYILGVGDEFVNNTWAITRAELEKIVELGQRALTE